MSIKGEMMCFQELTGPSRGASMQAIEMAKLLVSSTVRKEMELCFIHNKHTKNKMPAKGIRYEHEQHRAWPRTGTDHLELIRASSVHGALAVLYKRTKLVQRHFVLHRNAYHSARPSLR